MNTKNNYVGKKMKNLGKVRYIEGNYDERTQNLVRSIECSLYPGFVIPREFVRSLLDRILRTRH